MISERSMRRPMIQPDCERVRGCASVAKSRIYQCFRRAGGALSYPRTGMFREKRAITIIGTVRSVTLAPDELGVPELSKEVEVIKSMKRPFLASTITGIALLTFPLTALYSQERHEEQTNREEQHEEYHFRPEDAPKLRQHYKNIEKVDVAHRGEFRSGGRLPDDWRKRMHSVPVAVVRELPPPPPGYVFGYIDGYCVAYNPTTLLIADVIDLATLPH
jgi:Ni/Co efflux regulator RcnB